MAKKKVAQEVCIFCEQTPCECEGVSREKNLRAQHSNPTGSDHDQTHKETGG
jgi:hypothetical protein